MTLDLKPPRHSGISRFAQMSRRERAHACWLAIKWNWPLDPERWSYCSETDRVLVEYQLGGTCTFSKVAFDDPERTLAVIEERFGADARRRAEDVIR